MKKQIHLKCALPWLISILTLFSTSILAANFTGEIEILIADSFKKHKSQTIYQLKTSKTTFTLNFSKTQHAHQFKTGDLVSIQGEYQQSNRNMSVIYVTQIKLIKSFVPRQNINPVNHHALVLLVNFEDKKTTDSTSIEQVTAHMYAAPNSVRQNFLESSFSQVDFVPDTNEDSEPDVYTVNVNYSITDSCEPGRWASDARIQAETQGIHTTLYKHFVFVVPANASCGWGGLGHVGCARSCSAWIKWNDKIVYAHELGHNIGMHHASNDSNNDGTIDDEYGDWSGIMGNGGFHQVNAPHRIQMHWYDIFPNNIKTVTESETFKLYSLDKAPKRARKQIAIVTKEGLAREYYLSYRTNVGTFGMRDYYAKKINIHRFRAPAKQSLFIKPLAKGESFVDPEEGLKFTVKKIKNNFGSVSIQYLLKCSFEKSPCNLQQNDIIDGLDGEVNYLTIKVPEEASLLTIESSETVGSPDLKLFVKFNEMPTRKNFDCKSNRTGAVQVCTIENPQAGTWFVKIKSNLPHTGISLSNQIDLQR